MQGGLIPYITFYSLLTFARKCPFINNLYFLSENAGLKYGIYPFYFTCVRKAVMLSAFTVNKSYKNEIDVYANGG
jgi:hypothetical protein